MLNIPTVESEGENCGGAVFTNGSQYVLKQETSDENHYKAEGVWIVRVDDQGKFSMTVDHDAGDVTTQKASGPYGVLFYLSNSSKSYLQYDDNKGGEPRARQQLEGLSYDYAFAIQEEDPVNEGYDFAGWSLDGDSTTHYQGDVVKMDTVNVAEHVLKACWRSPLTVKAVIHTNGSETEVQDSEAIFRITEERTQTFEGIQGVSEAYADQNSAVQALNGRKNIGLAYATLMTSGKTVEVASLRYNASEHAWQYRLTEGSTQWTNTGKGDVLTLHYVSNVMTIRAVLEKEDGSYETMGEAAEVSIGGSWEDEGTLIAEALRPVVMGKGYFAYYGIGSVEASKKSDLTKADLSSFAVKNTDAGFRFRTDQTEG